MCGAFLFHVTASAHDRWRSKMVTRTGFGAPGSDGGRTATLAPENRHSGSPLSGAVADDADTLSFLRRSFRSRNK
ncbi:hypothetical protein MRX96_054865 [Rhipicephalus microplus]